MLGWRSSGLRPLPSATSIAGAANGVSRNTSSAAKNAAKPSRTAVAYGAIRRSRLRVRNSTRLDHIDNSHSHSISEPSCEDHAAAAL